MTMTQTNEDARRYIDRIQQINLKHGLSSTMSTDEYERAVDQASRAVSSLAERAQSKP